MGIWDWLRSKTGAGDGRYRCAAVPHIEPLEPRVLLNADFMGIDPALSPGPAAPQHVISVDVDVCPDSGQAAPALPGLELVDRDPDSLRGQVIFLDFDGQADITYSGPVRVGPLDVPAFKAPAQLGGAEEVIVIGVVEDLEQAFAGSGVLFTAEHPVDTSAHSTIYVGGDDSAFADYGEFLGLAETVDVGNRDWGDNALVFSENVGCASSDLVSYISELASVIAHEAGHLLGYGHAEPMSSSSCGSVNSAGAGGPLGPVAQFAGPDDGESAADYGPVHQWLTYNAFLFYDSQFAGSELAEFIGDWTDYGSEHHRTNGDDNDVIEGTFDEDVSKPTTYIFDDGFHWDIVPQNPLGQDTPYYRHFVAGGDGDEIYVGWNGYASAVTQATDYWQDHVLDNYLTDKASSYYYLGHVAHLLEDMTVPAHVHNDAHPIRDAYEYTMGEHSNYLLWGHSDDARTQPTGSIETPKDLTSLFQETIDYTEEYPSDDYSGDDEAEILNANRHRPDLVSRSGGFTGDGKNLDESSHNEMTIIADDLMPWAMERVAALFRLFYSYVDFAGPTVDFLTSFGTSEETAVLKPSQFHIAATAQDESGCDADGFRFIVERKNGTSWEPLSVDPNGGAFDFVAPTDGVYRIAVEVEDAVGNVGRSSEGYFYTDQASGLRPVYRFWSPKSGSHLYTMSESERDKLITLYPPQVWTYEGTAFYAYAQGQQPQETTAVYRFWSAQSGVHFYTTDEAERDRLIDLFPPEVWTYESVAFYVLSPAQLLAGMAPVYRMLSSRLGSDLFTVSQAERDKLLELYPPEIWTYGGIAWYAYAP